MKAPLPALEISESTRALLERLRRDSDRLFGTRRAQVLPLTFQIRESSEVARARVTTSLGVRHVFAKTFRPRPGETGLAETRRRFRRDYEVTRQVFERMRSTADLRSVEPIACYEDLLGVVTNEAPGLPLNVAITKNAAWPTTSPNVASLEVALSRTGRWIAEFQRLAPDAAPSRLNLDAVREYIDTRLVRLTKLPRAAFDHSDRVDLLSYFDRRAAAVPSADLVEVPIHGDIVPSNVIADPACITVLDFGMTTRGSKYLDIARLYTQLHFFTAKPQFRPRVMARLQSAALSAFEPRLEADHPLFEICAVQHVVCHLVSHARQPGPFPGSIYSRHLCWQHRRWLRRRIEAAKRRDVEARELAGSVE